MDIMSKFNLPTYVKGKSFSEASAMIAKRFNDRNSPEDVATLNDLQGRLQQAQEFVKAQQEARTNPSHQMPDGSMMNGSNHQQQASNIPADAGMGAEPSGSEHASNEFEGGGGLLDSLFPKDASGAEGGVGAGGYAQAAMGLADMAKTAFGPTGIDTSGATASPDVPSQGASAASGAMKGAMAGKSFGPWGAAIGGVLGGAAGFIGGGKENKDANKADFNYDVGQHNQASNSYKSGGQMLANMYDKGGHAHPHGESSGYNPNEEDDYYDNQNSNAYFAGEADKRSAFDSSNDYFAKEADKRSAIDSSNASFAADADARKAVNYGNTDVDPVKESKFNPAELLRYAPAAMNLAQLANLKKPEKVGLDRLGNKYEEQLVDERELQNVVQEGTLNTRDALLSSSGGSGSTARANLLASQLQGTKALSQAYQSAGAENRQERRKGQQFDLGVDQTNLGQSNQEKNINLQLDAGYKSNKSKLMAQLGDDLGGIGQEELFKRYPELMGLSYGAKGQHLSSEEKRKAAKKAARKQKN